MKKTIIAVLFAVLLVFPLVFLSVCAVIIPPQYDGSFLSVLSKKHDELIAHTEDSIILVGGSNLPFGIDSALLESYVGMPVINFGLYAALGTKPMLDLCENHIQEGDIVIICPETSPQTYSTYFGADSMLMALDGNFGMLSEIKESDYPKLICALPSFVSSKYSFFKSGAKPIPSDIYSPKSFGDGGDISTERKYNEMPSNYDNTTPIRLSKDITSDEFIEYLNKFAKKAEGKGAKVLFSFSPMNRAALVATSEKDEFYRYLGENLDFPIISDINDYILSSDYFYDTNFHLNSRGAKHRTALLADDILRELGDTRFVETVKYSAPKRPADYFAAKAGENDTTGFFVFEKTAGGVALVGLSESGSKQKTLNFPKAHDGLPVISIGKAAFSSSKVLETLIIDKDCHLAAISEKAFSSCPSLRKIHIALNPEKLNVSQSSFDGMSSSCFVYVPEELFGSFATDYFWSGHMEHVRSES